MRSKCEKLSDIELVALLQLDELSAFIEIYNRYWSKLFNAAYKRVKDQEACKEIVQDIFTNFWTKRHVLVLTTGLSNYLYTATRNQVIDYYRKQVIRNNFQFGLLHEGYDNSNEQNLLLKDLQQHIERLIDQLPAKCKSVYQLSRVENLSNKEIASLLNISEKTVEGHLTKALKQLRVSLSGFLVLMVLLLIK